MKAKTLVVLLSLVVISLFSVIYSYGFDPQVLLSLSFYESLANPSVKIVRIQEGLRKEQIADIMQEKLNWTDQEKDKFINVHLALNTNNLEGRYFPKTYMILKDAGPESVTSTMFHEFSTQTSKIKKPKSMQVINQETALTIASIIQRESNGKNDMKIISGIIWNRIFLGMKLQIDATLQYAKGTEANGWWTQVTSKDKLINSPYNTYKYKDLPPTPISNPGLVAIEAAYNPVKTSCLYYLHDKKGGFHCSKTYEEHLKNIDKYY